MTTSNLTVSAARSTRHRGQPPFHLRKQPIISASEFDKFLGALQALRNEKRCSQEKLVALVQTTMPLAHRLEAKSLNEKI